MRLYCAGVNLYLLSLDIISFQFVSRQVCSFWRICVIFKKSKVTFVDNGKFIVLLLVSRLRVGILFDLHGI